MSSPVSNQNSPSPNESTNQRCSHPSNQPKVILLAVAFSLIVAMLSSSQLLPQNLCAGIMLALPFTSFQVKAFTPSTTLIFATPVHLLVSWANIKVAEGYPQFCRQGGHWCLSCLNITYCQSCRNGYYVNSQGKCMQCQNNPACNVCDPDNPSKCLQCKPNGYILQNSRYCQSQCYLTYYMVDFACISCVSPTNCFICQTQLLSPQYAYQRDTNSSGLCQRCNDIYCIKCADNKSYCQECDQFRALFNGSCFRCDLFIPNCYRCFSNRAICYQCINYFGVNLTDNKCYPCLDPNCWDCSGNLQFCQRCNSPYGVNLTDRSCHLCGIGYRFNGLICQPCDDPNCIKCPNSNTICTECSPQYGVIIMAVNASVNFYIILDSTCTTCQDVRCVNCSLDYESCTQCQVTYVAISGDCQICSYYINYCWACQLNSTNAIRCLQCFDNSRFYSTPTVDGYVICERCDLQIDHCFTCQLNANSEVSCLQCVNNSFYVVQNANSQGVCQNCDFQIDYCSTCQLNANSEVSCLQCVNNSFYVVQNANSQGVCQNCDFQIDYCSTCQLNANSEVSCLQCVNNSFYVVQNANSQGVCQNCDFQIDYCSTCQLNANSEVSCLQCVNNSFYVVQNANSQGVCQNCDFQIDYCSTCQLNANSEVSCLQCVNNSFYVVQNANSQGVCQNCDFQIDYCSTCQLNANSEVSCLQCVNNSFYVVQNANSQGVCQNCDFQIDYCSTCQLNANSEVSCLQCVNNSFYVVQNANSQGVCQNCDFQIDYCSTCQLNANSEVSCLQCVNNSFYLAQNASNPQVYICPEVCGDLEAYILECDNEIGIPFDGCTDTCQVQDQFVCQVESSTRLTKCLFYGAPLLEIKSISKRDKFENKINVVVKITPKLHVFQQIPLQQFIKTFQMSPNTTIDSMLYDHQSGIITFNCSIDDSLLQGQDFFIEFLPNLISLQQFSLMNSSTANTTLSQTYYFYTQFQITMYKLVYFVFYAICGLGVLSCILSLILRNLPGLEAMLVLQFSWISLFWSTSQYYDFYELVEPLKYSTGYNHAFLPENEVSSLDMSPHYAQLGVSIDHIANNFSFVFILQLLALVSVLVTVVRLRTFNKNNPNVNALSKKELYDQQQSFVGHSETAYQCLMFSVVLGLGPFVNNAIIFFKFSNDRAIPDYAILAVQVLLIVFVIVKNLLDPSVFGYFRFSFRTEELAMKHYLIKITVLVLTLVLVSMLQEYSYASVAPLAMMVAYTLIYRPYKYVKQNLRSAFNYLVMCSFLGFCVFVDHYVQTKQPRVQIGLFKFVKVYFLINFVALLVIVIVGSIIFSILYYFQEKNLQEQKQAKNQAQRQKQKLGDKILKQMVRTQDVNQTFRKILQQSTFKEVLNPDVSLLDAAIQLKQKHQQQQQKNKGRQMQVKQMEKERTHRQSGSKTKAKNKMIHEAKLQLQQTQMETQLKNYYSNRKRELESLNETNAHQLSQLEQGNGDKIRQCKKMMEKQKLKKQPKLVKQVFVKHNITCDNGITNTNNSEITKKTSIEMTPNAPISQSLEVKTQLVEKTLVSEHNFLRLRGAETIIKKEMSQPKEANEDLYLKMYEDIDVAINNSANGRITKKQ